MSKLLDGVRDILRTRFYSYRTEETYINWIRQYIIVHKKRHPAEMAAPEVTKFLTWRSIAFIEPEPLQLKTVST